jgi:Zn-dependent protease
MPVRPSPRGGIVLFRLGAIEIAVHPSWFVMFAVLSIIVHLQITPDVVARDGGLAPLVSIGIALLFYSFILAHELSHAIVARAYGIDAKRITLFIFGGVAQIGSEAQRPAHEYQIALAGPLASLIIACVLAAVSRLLHPSGDPFPGLWGYLSGVNLALALFNLIPAFPLDGGRLLRAGLWAGLRDRAKATRWAATMGKGFAFVLMGAGGAIVAISLFDRDPEGAFGIWYVVIGYFIFTIAGAAGRAEGGAEPRGPGSRDVPRDLFDETVRPPEPPVTVGADEGEAAEPDAGRRGAGAPLRPEPPRPPADQSGDGPRHP